LRLVGYLKKYLTMHGNMNVNLQVLLSEIGTEFVYECVTALKIDLQMVTYE
jgi:hypothetical protein